MACSALRSKPKGSQYAWKHYKGRLLQETKFLEQKIIYSLLFFSLPPRRRKREGERGGRKDTPEGIVSFVELPRTEENAQAERINDEIRF